MISVRLPSIISQINKALLTSNNTLLLNKTVLPTCSPHRDINLKPKLKEFVHCDYVDSMDYGIYALTTGYIKEAAMEAVRISIVRRAKTKQVWKIVSESPFTKKPLGTRMGKGKGKLDHWASKAIAGQVLFEFSCDNDYLARDAFKQAKAKLPVRLHLRIKPKESRKILNGEEFLQLYEDEKERNERLGLDVIIKN